jgi:predicted acylesterase/phospholipase RssA
MGTGPVVRLFVRALALLVPVALACAVGCAGRDGARVPEALALKNWQNARQTDDYRDADAAAVEGLGLAMQGAAPERPANKPINILCVSGGGKYAAFAAGALNGWTATGTRPTFDVCNGISSGAAVALMAFLGPKYDGDLRDIFLNLKRSDLFVWRPVVGIATGTGLMSSRPLEQLLACRITAEVVADVRAAHRFGRRLFVGTQNVFTHRLVVWDVGALADSGRPDAVELVRKVLLAACSIPGIVPPVEFDVTVNGRNYKELHADAGNLSQVFVRTAGPLPPGSAVWILSAGKTHPNVSKGRPRVIESMALAVSAGLYALFRADCMKLYALCGVTRSRFNLMAVPQDFQGRTSSMVFYREESARLYLTGYQMATGAAWQTRPPDGAPGGAPGDVPPPRAGTDFLAPE